jgi:hypothetical protein
VSGLRDKALVRSNHIEIPYLVYRDPQKGTLVKAEFESLAQFFCLLERVDMDPVVLLHPDGGEQPASDSVKKLQVLGTAIATSSTQLMGAVADQSVPARLLLDRTGFLGEILVDSWESVQVKDLQAVQDAGDEGWKFLFPLQFTPTEALYQQLVEATALLRQLKL